MSSSERKRVVIIGSSFAGLTAAFELKKKVGDRHEIVVLDPRPDFTFIPSLIWLPFGGRQAKDVTFPLAPIYARKGIRFINEAAEKIDPAAHTVTTSSGEELAYDRLFIGTGPRLAFEKVPGLGPHDGHTQSVCNLEHALLARDEWDRFLRTPGPVVIGTAQGGSCFGASYEFMFNAHHQIKKAGLQDVAPVTFITAEPFLGHFGLGGVGNSEQMINRFFDKLGIEGRPNTVIKEARARRDRARRRHRPAGRVLDDRAAVHRRRRRSATPRVSGTRWGSFPSTSSSATPSSPTSSPPASRSRSPRRSRRRSRPGCRRPGR